MRHLNPPFACTIARYATCPEDYHLARQSSRRRSRIYARHDPVSSSSSGSSLTRRQGVLSIGSRFRDTTQKIQSRCVREEISLSPPYLYPRPGRHRAPLRFALRILRVGSRQIARDCTRLIRRYLRQTSESFRGARRSHARFHARFAVSCLLSSVHFCDTRNVFDTR